MNKERKTAGNALRRTESIGWLLEAVCESMGNIANLPMTAKMNRRNATPTMFGIVNCPSLFIGILLAD